MRIDLDEHEEQGRGNRRLSQKHRRGSHSRSFDSALTIPAALPKQQAGTGSAAARNRQQLGPRAAELPQPEAVQPLRSKQGQSAVSRALVGLLLVALVAATAYASMAEPFFVRGVEVTGNEHVSYEAILQASQVEALHIFWVRPKEVAKRIENLDGIRSVTVRCALPGRVRIDVQERQSVLRWHDDAKGVDWWLDEEGVMLPYPAEQGSTIVVHDMSGLALQSDRRLAQPGLVAAVQQMASALPEVTVYYYHADTGLSFVQTAKGREWPVYLGDGQDLQRKLQAVEAITSYLMQNGIRPRYVDVRWPEHPVYGTPAGKKESGG